MPPSGTSSSVSEMRSLAGTTARFIQMQANSSHGSTTYIGLSEVAIDGTATGRGVNLPVSSVSATSNFANRGPINVTNGSGFANAFTSGHTVTVDNNMWMSAGAGLIGNEELTFDLGSTTDVGAIRIWNYNQAGADTDRGVRRFDLLASTDGTTYFPLLTDAELAQAPGNDAVDSSQVFQLGDIAGGIAARYFRLGIDTNWGDSQFVGLSEVQFLSAFLPAAQVVPEPASIALWSFVGGAALIYFGVRRFRPTRVAEAHC